MSRTPDANVNPELLVWARVSRGFPRKVAAAKLDVEEAKLRAWEEGEDALTMARLRQLANLYKRPLGVFFRDKPPQDPPRPTDFRRPSDAHDYSPELLLEIRRATINRETAIRLAEQLGEVWMDLHEIPPGTSAGDVAQLLRAELGVTLEQQFAADGAYDALRLWRQAVERLGVLVFQSKDVPPEEMRGFSISARPFPAIVLNPKDAVRARVFTLLHELAHIYKGGSAICLPHAHTKGTEEFCNQVAADVLVPVDALREHEVVRANRGAWEWSSDQMKALSTAFGVSEEVILYRLLDAGLTNRAFVNTARRHYAWRRAAADGNGGPTIEVKVVANLGRPFIRLVMDSLSRDAITLGEASRFLGTKVAHFDAIDRQAFG